MKLKWIVAAGGSSILLAIGWLTLYPPETIRVGANYTAKIICSNVFLANRDAQDVLQVDVQAPGHPLLRLMQVDVNRETSLSLAVLIWHSKRAR